MSEIEIRNRAVTVQNRPGQSLLNILLHEGQPIHTVCGGRARCGCCRILVIGDGRGTSPVHAPERIFLGGEQLAEGWRLGCQTYTLRDIVIYLPGSEELEPHCSK